MPAKYAERTDVPADRSQVEIATLLRRYGADAYASGFEDGRAVVMFRSHDRNIRFVLPLPDPNDRAFTRTATGQRRKNPKVAYEAEVRRIWRSFVLVIKAKLEAVATGIVTFEDEFLAYTVLPDNRTIGTAIAPELDHALTSGNAPTRLLLIEGPR